MTMRETSASVSAMVSASSRSKISVSFSWRLAPLPWPAGPEDIELRSAPRKMDAIRRFTASITAGIGIPAGFPAAWMISMGFA